MKGIYNASSLSALLFTLVIIARVSENSGNNRRGDTLPQAGSLKLAALKFHYAEAYYRRLTNRIAAAHLVVSHGYEAVYH